MAVPESPRRAASADSSLSRRDFLARAATVAGVGVIAPFSFVHRVSAGRPALHRFVRDKMHEAHTPGLSVAVVRGDDIVWSAGAGWANKERGVDVTPDTVFMLASVAKTVTCAAIMALVEDGTIDLDEDINRYLPFDVHIPMAPRVPVTMRMLLTHTSAIRDRPNVWGTPYSKKSLYFHGDSPIALGDFERSYLVPGGARYVETENFYRRRPGQDYSYSNLAVALAGYVAEAATGTDFNALFKRRILHPLGMEQSGFRRTDITTPNLAMPYHIDRDTRQFLPYFQYGYPDYPDGALRASAVNLATWLGAFMHFGTFRGVRVLEHSTVEEMRRGQIPRIVPWQQGLIWYVVTAGKYVRMGHTGGDFGMSSRMFFRLDRQVGVVSLTNAYLSGRRWDAFRDIELRLFDEFS